MEVGMKIKLPVALFAVLGSIMIASYAQAQNSYLYIAHAASGRGMSTPTNAAFPVDLSVNGVCIATGISYGEIRGPFSGPAGPYFVQFSIADYSNPCGGVPVFGAEPTLAADTTYYGVLTLDASGSVVGQLYAPDVSPVTAGSSRLIVINVTPDDLSGTFSTLPGSLFPFPANSVETFNPGSGLYTTSVLDSSQNLLVGPVNLELEQGNAYVYVVAGSTATNVQWLGPTVIRGLF
jgi:hypothetical protein